MNIELTLELKFFKHIIGHIITLRDCAPKKYYKLGLKLLRDYKFYESFFTFVKTNKIFGDECHFDELSEEQQRKCMEYKLRWQKKDLESEIILNPQALLLTTYRLLVSINDPYVKYMLPSIVKLWEDYAVFERLLEEIE